MSADLKLVADELWNEATRETVLKFMQQLKVTADAIHRGSLFLEESHYQQLKHLLDSFGRFYIGKAQLIDIRSEQDFDRYYIEEHANRQIERNRTTKNEYEDLIEIIRRGFLTHLRESGLK
jgi:hypothetical protein